MNFWENLTPLDSSHLKVFLGIFWNFFIFLNSNLNFEFGLISYRTKPEPVRTGQTGPVTDGLVTGYRRFGEPDAGSQNSIGQHNRSALGAASVAARSRIRVSGPIAAGARRQGAGAGDTSARALAASFGGGDLVGSSRWEGEAGADAAARAT